MALLLGCFIVLRRPHQTSAALGILLGVIGTAAVAVSATRLVLATSYAGVTGTLAIGRRWRSVLAVTVIAAAILVLRPELVQRFQTAVNEAFGGGPAASAQASPVATQQPETTDNTSELGDPSLHTRLVVWDRILAAWSKEPILGIGPGMTAPTIAEASGAQRVAPHNDYIGALAELGIIGFCLFVGLQLAVGVLLWGSGSRSPPMTERLGTPARAALVVFLCFNVLGALNNPSYFLDIQVAVWALVGAGLASRNQPREETATSNAAMAAAGS
jgi:O-antigen ligase